MPNMKGLQTVIFSLLLSFIWSGCTIPPIHNPGPPNPTPIEKLKQTEFVATLENHIAEHKNIIYCPTLLFAWDIVKQNNITLSDSVSRDFKLLNQSSTYRNSLNDDEKLTEADFSGEEVTIKSFFNKDVPFPGKLQKFDSGMFFNNQKVSAFGVNGFDKFITTFTQIAFYRDDNNFIIKITSKDTTSEILLIKGLENVQTLNDAVEQTKSLIKAGDKDVAAKNSWKHRFMMDDSLCIPMIKFNIEKHYNGIERQTFLLGGKEKIIQEAYQKIAFSLDENGVYVESNAEIEIASAYSIAISQKPHPKHLKFDKPFYIIVEHLNRDPYFVMKVDNLELLEKL